MKNKAKFWVLLPVAVLCACGKIGNLEPQAGSKPIPVANGNTRAETADELVAASAQSRPGRSVELLRRSERREIDPFDLPPGIDPEAKNATAEQTAAPVVPKNR